MPVARRRGTGSAILPLITVPPPTPPPSSQQWFAPDSPWNTRIPANVGIVAGSSGWLSALFNSTSSGVNINYSGYTTSVWTLAGGESLLQWKLDNAWLLDNVPTPANLSSTQRSGVTEWYGVLVDYTNRRIWGFLTYYYGRNQAGFWGASSGAYWNLDGSGFWDQNSGTWAGRAAGSNQGAGLIRKAEWSAGVIPHALAFAAHKNTVVAPTWVSPASQSDGLTNGGLPMGSRIQLDPTINLDTAPFVRAGTGDKIVYKALQDYGAYVVDCTFGGMAFYAQQVDIGDAGSGSPNNIAPFTSPSPLDATFLNYCRVVTPPPVPVFDQLGSQPHH